MVKRKVRMFVFVFVTVCVLLLVAVMCWNLLRGGMYLDGITVTQHRLRGTAIAIQSYSVTYGHLPPGDLPTIIAILGGEDRGGENSQHIVFREFEQKEINRHGDWIDEWGTPIQLIHIGTTNILLKSFGKNRRDDGGTNDDITESVFKQ